MKRKNKVELTAATADPHLLYEESVQSSESTIQMIESVFDARGFSAPASLREDFCGTARLCVDWVASRPDRTALGLDIDSGVLRWAETNNLESLEQDARRVTLVKRDVLEGHRRRVDVTVALNFSYWVFHERQELVQYFKKVRQSLKKNGCLILNLHGGPDAQFQLEEITEFDGFDYVWEQGEFDAVNNRAKCYIHFRFDDGSSLEQAFIYDWRIWSLPELRDALTDAGFSRIDVWWEDEENDRLFRVTRQENTESWIANLAAWR